MPSRITHLLIAALAVPAVTAFCFGQPLDTLKVKTQADSLSARADSLLKVWKYNDALPLYQSALLDYQQLEDKAGQAAAYGGMGNALNVHVQRRQEALSSFENRLSLERELGNRKGEAEALIDIGNAKRGLSQPARNDFGQSLQIAREIRDRRLEALSLHGLAWTYNVFSDDDEPVSTDSSLILCQQALRIAQEIGDRDIEAKELYLLGQTYLDYYDLAKSLSYYLDCLKIYQELKDLKNQARAAQRVGFVYSWLGDEFQALQYHEQGLELSRQVEDSSGISWCFLYLGIDYQYLHEYPQALDCCQQALDYFQATGSQNGVMMTRGTLGDLYTDLGQYDKALYNLQCSLDYRKKTADHLNTAVVLISLARLYFKQGNCQKAILSAKEALSYASKRFDTGLITVEGNQILADSYYAQGSDSLGIACYKTAMTMLESMRGMLNVASHKSGFIAPYSGIYEGIALASLKTGHVDQAFDYAERGRARAFLDLLASAQVKVGKPGHLEFLAQKNQYQKEKQQTEEQIGAAGEDTAKVVALRGKLAGDWGKILTGLEETEREEPELASLVSVNPLTLPEVQKLLDKETTLLEYFLTEKKTLVWLVTRKHADVFQVERGGDSLKSLVQEFRRAIENRGKTDGLSRQLYDLLVAPAAGKIETENLIIVPHGILHYLPFAALQDPKGRCLLDDYRIRYLPSASVLRYLPSKRKGLGPSTDGLLALGNPATDRKGYEAIPLTETEVQEIGTMVGQSQVLTGPRATEADFKRLAPQYDILHLACHGDLNSAYPLYSCLLLAPDSSEDGELDVHEIFNLDLHASLVVLSGCQTGLGHLTNGDELVGLSRAFIYAGTPSIVSSLWMVEDESTAYLMERFYHHLQSQDKAQALRQAQLETRQKYPVLRSWASFVLTGDNI